METLFWISILLLVYTYAGYPLAIRLMASLRPRVVLRRRHEPPVTLIVVVRDGGRWIDDKLSNCLTLDYPHDQLDVVVVSDGSTDGTVERARAFESPRVTIVECSERRGKAACLNDAVAHARGDILVFTDVRQRLRRCAIRNLVMNFADETVGAVSGELVLERSGSGFAGGMDLYWRYEKWLRASEARFHSSVGVTGAIYAMRRECYRPIPPQTVLDDVLIPMNVVFSGLRVVFDRNAVAYDIASSSRAREQRRKVRTIAGNYQLLLLCPALLNPFRNPLWWQFVSHKLLRLIVPVFLAAALATNLQLASQAPFYRFMLAAQIGLYAIALSGIVSPALQRIRLVRVPAMFVMLNWFAVLGFLRFARHGRRLPW